EASMLGLEQVVEFTGPQDTAQVRQLLHDADVFVLASHGKGEAAPAVVCEAMACGLPVITTTIGATPAMVTSGKDGYLVPQKDPDALHAALEKMACNDELLRELRRGALETSRAFDCMDAARRVLA